MITLTSRQFRIRLVRTLAIVLALAMITPLAACGRKGPPDFPEGSKYPREYPSE